MNSDAIWNSGPFFSPFHDANVEQFLETSECEPLPEDHVNSKPAIAIKQRGSWLKRCVSSLFRTFPNQNKAFWTKSEANL